MCGRGIVSLYLFSFKIGDLAPFPRVTRGRGKAPAKLGEKEEVGEEGELIRIKCDYLPRRGENCPTLPPSPFPSPGTCLESSLRKRVLGVRRGGAHDFLGFPKWAKLKNSPRAFLLKRRVHKERIPRLKGLKKG